MNPLIAIGVGWFVLKAIGNKEGAAQGAAPRVIDASGPGLKLLPAPGKPAQKPKPAAKPAAKPPQGQVTIGEPRIIKTPAKPVPPAAPLRTPQQAAKPVTPSKAPVPSAKTAAATAAARAALPQVPAAAQARPAAPPGTDLAKAKRMAPNVAANLKKAGKAYDRKQLGQFQTASGLKPDGLYGPVAKSALSYFGAAAPAPMFKGQDLKYVPPQGA